MFTPRFMYDPAPAAPAANDGIVSLTDIMDGVGSAPPPVAPKLGDPGYVLKEGDPGYIPLTELKFGDPGYILKPGDQGYVAPAPELKLGDPGYVLKEGDPGYIAPESEEDEKPFWQAVEEITGSPVTVEYPEGVDPQSPEGAAIREHEVRKLGGVEFEKYLEDKFPRAYAFFMHQKAGLPEDKFFSNPVAAYTLPARETLKDSVDAQSAIYKYDLTSRGLDAGAVQMLVDAAVKDSTLAAKADAAYTTVEQAQKAQLEEIQKLEVKEQKEFELATGTLTRKIDDNLAGMSFVVPQAEQADFKKFVLNQIRYDNGNFYVVQPVGGDSKDVQKLMESLFFQFKKGDLATIVKRNVSTKTSQRLSTIVKATNTPGNSGNNGPNKAGAFVSLGDLGN